jgi:hypothetical protein
VSVRVTASRLNTWPLRASGEPPAIVTFTVIGGLGLKRRISRSSHKKLLVQLVISDVFADLSQREERHQDDEHDDPDHKYTLQTSSAYGWHAIGKCLTVPHSNEDLLKDVERYQYHGKYGRLENATRSALHSFANRIRLGHARVISQKSAATSS